VPESLPETPPSDPATGTNETLPSPPSRGVIKSSVVWIGGGFACMQIIRFGSSIMLASLLYPEAFGLFALCFAFLTGLHLFSDLGIRVSIIQSPRGDDPVFLNTAWTIQIVRGFVLWIGAAALAWPAAYWRPEPEPALLWLLPLLAFTTVIEGFTSTKLHGLHRHLLQRRAVLIDLVSSIVSVVIMLTWASFSPGLLAMAAGPLSNALMQMSLSHLLPGPRNRFRYDRQSAHELVHFGRWIFISTICTFLADHVDRVVVSFISLATLGVYHLANQIAMVPSALMGTVARQVVLPIYSRMIDAGSDLREAVRLVQLRAGALSALLVAGLIAIAPTLIRCLYDDRYQEAGWILPMLAVSGLLQILDSNGSSLLIARGKPRIYALSNGVKVFCLILFMPVGAWVDGLRGLIAALLLGDLARYRCTALAARYEGFPIFRRDVVWIFFALGVGFCVQAMVDRWLPPILPGRRNWPLLIERLLWQGGLVVAVWGIVIGFLWRGGWFHVQKHE